MNSFQKVFSCLPFFFFFFFFFLTCFLLSEDPTSKFILAEKVIHVTHS